MIKVFSFKGILETRNKAVIAILVDCGLRTMEVRTLNSINVKETTIVLHGEGNIITAGVIVKNLVLIR